MKLKWHRATGQLRGMGNYYADGKVELVCYWLSKSEMSDLGWCVELSIPSATYENTEEQMIVQKSFDYCSHSIGWFPTIDIAKNVCQMLEDYIESKLLIHINEVE